ncbi:Transcription factor FAR1-related [Pyrenophora seminiperda CCB06]|uniref:Transcription factor FAR1-related n=1 Tax=Pyrenophora seminiperda CCB06 TaxID=1302712 RepID=A0A3M7M8S3_9PLEO|nr:Transcription factor FAR1-related [Pyrenophora seminiperda CCB06]
MELKMSSSSSISLKQPLRTPARLPQLSGAQFDASCSPSRLPSVPPVQDEDSDSSINRLLRQEDAEDSDSDCDRVLGAEDELESASAPRRRRKREYRPRRRNHGRLRQAVEGEDCDLRGLWESSLRSRDHLPPPELVYPSFDDAVAGVQAWAKEHGLAYRKQKWALGRRYRLLMSCSRSGKPRDRRNDPIDPDIRRRPGATSQKTGCKMQFYLVAVDYTQLEGQWRVKWCKNRASITHNHPPDCDVRSIATYKRAERNDEIAPPSSSQYL